MQMNCGGCYLHQTRHHLQLSTDYRAHITEAACFIARVSNFAARRVKNKLKS